MAITEKSLKRRVLRELNAMPNCKAITTAVPGVETGTPDILGCYRGKMFALELKVGKNQPTDLQQHRLKQWAAAGAVAIVVREPFGLKERLEWTE